MSEHKSGYTTSTVPSDALCVCGHSKKNHSSDGRWCFGMRSLSSCDCLEYHPASPPAYDTPAAKLRERIAELEQERDSLRFQAAALRAELAALHPLADMAAGLLAEKQ